MPPQSVKLQALNTHAISIAFDVSQEVHDMDLDRRMVVNR